MKSWVLDASALLAFLNETSGAAKVIEILEQAIDGRALVLMSAVNYGEVYGTSCARRASLPRLPLQLPRVDCALSCLTQRPLAPATPPRSNIDTSSTTVTASPPHWHSNAKLRW
jgi:predicted nucleic acid-binding protein